MRGIITGGRTDAGRYCGPGLRWGKRDDAVATRRPADDAVAAVRAAGPGNYLAASVAGCVAGVAAAGAAGMT
ncbi:hypothetical protein DDE05_30250, partial [Streptomyces cavourensis]